MENKKYFYGNEISAYGRQYGRVDYRALAKSFDAVLNNQIMEKTYDIGYWELESGFINNYDEIEELQEKIDELLAKADVQYDDELLEQIEELNEQIAELEQEADDSYYPECYQYYIVSDAGAAILKKYNFIVWYNDVLDMYVWGVTHWGTSWDYVLTDIEIPKDNV